MTMAKTCSHRGVEAAHDAVHVNAYTQSMWCIACIFNIVAPGETLM